LLDHSTLLRELRYEPETGIWRRKPSRRHPEGRICGSVKTQRRKCGTIYSCRIVSLHRKNYFAHRLAWFYVTGAWPEKEIDHKNTDALDNKWANLRLATDSQQKQNSKTRHDNRTQVRGVRLETSGRFGARIFYGGKHYWLGTFDSIEEASKVYIEAARRQFKEFAYA
jgi:hypothetical protein